LHYTGTVIKSFQHKGLERLFRRGETKGILAQHVGRGQRILDLLDDAADPQELKIPGLFLHPLKGDRKGQWAVSVSGNWRITFASDGEDVIVVDLEDYH
jgi:proteic killer suppression protein